MERNVNKIKKLAAAITLGLVSAFAFAQEANDGFVVPLEEDFSKPAAQNAESTNNGVLNKVKSVIENSQMKQGLWIELASKNNSLIRNVSDGTKKGYEFDNSHFTGEFNWWFWGQINKYFQLDAEIGVLKFDKTLYQANTYGDNVADVTWGDGFQSLGEMFFSPLKEGNDDGVGAFNKFALNMATPFVDARFGYGDLKANGMSQFEGIFNVIDRWNYVGDGYMELKNGSSVKEFGDVKIDALAALSEMKKDSGYPFGTYNYLDVKYSDLVEGALTFGSGTTRDELFYYNKSYVNAFSTYLAVNPIDPLKLEGHIIKTWGTDVDTNDTIALAGRAGWKAETWNVRVMQSAAGKNVNSVWGSEGQDYDNINVNTATTQVDLEKGFELPQVDFSIGLDETVTYVLTDEDGTDVASYKGFTSFRTQPYADIDLNKIINQNVKIGLYSVFDFDRISNHQADSLSESRKFVSSVDELGIEFNLADFFGLKKATFDYALKNKWNSNSDDFSTRTWTGGSSYDLGRMYHSLMLNVEFNDKYAAHFGAVVRNDKDDDDTNVPFAFAVGGSIRKIPLPGHPMLWVHATYSLAPYEDNNYTLYRADDPLERASHRTYLLNTLDYSSVTNSEISVGLIWDL